MTAVLKALARSLPNLAFGSLCFFVFFIETGKLEIGTLASWVVDWPHYEIYAFFVVPPLALAERPLGAKVAVGIGIWILIATALVAPLSEDVLIAIPFLLAFAVTRAISHAGVTAQDGSEALRLLFFLVPSLFVSFLAGMVFTGVFGDPIAMSAEFNDREMANTLTFRDYLLAAGGFYFYAAVLWEVLVSPALSKPS